MVAAEGFLLGQSGNPGGRPKGAGGHAHAIGHGVEE